MDEAGVYEAAHLSITGYAWVYAANSAGRIIAWREYAPGDVERRDTLVADLWDLLAEAETPALTLIHPRPELADYPPGTVEAAALQMAFGHR